MRCIKIKDKYRCDNCNMFLLKRKGDGYIQINSKCKEISTNGKSISFTCRCGKKYEVLIK